MVSCQVTSHIPQLSRQLNLLILYTGALQIENSEESDQGKYECVAMNSAGTRYSSPANLYVRGNVKYMLIVLMSVSVAFDTSVLISPSCFGHQLGGAACLSVSISLLMSLGLSAQQFIRR